MSRGIAASAQIKVPQDFQDPPTGHTGSTGSTESRRPPGSSVETKQFALRVNGVIPGGIPILFDSNSQIIHGITLVLNITTKPTTIDVVTQSVNTTLASANPGSTPTGYITLMKLRP